MRWILDLPEDRVIARSDAANARRRSRPALAILAASRQVFLRQGLDPDDDSVADALRNLPPAGYERIAVTPFYSAYAAAPRRSRISRRLTPPASRGFASSTARSAFGVNPSAISAPPVGDGRSAVAAARGAVSSLHVTTNRDHDLLSRAIELGRRGLGRVSPNPLVGAVVARDGEIVGEGWHDVYGGPHAEVAAIRSAGDADLRGTTLYVSLEPCCHEGQQPPCTDAIIAAGIGRVVVASDDPSEKANGRGLGILRDEGIEVELAGRRPRRARAAREPGLPQALAHRPAVGAVQVGDEPRRQRRDARRRLAVDLRASRAASSRTTGAPRSTRSSSGSARRSPTTRA